MKIIINILIRALIILGAAYILPGVHLAGFEAAVIVAIVLGILNMFIRPIILILTLPINILTLGLFTFVINALLVLLAAKIVPGFAVSGFWWAVLFSLVVSIVSAFFSRLERSAQH